MKRLFLFLALILSLLAFPSAALADIAPPYNPPGSNPQPDSENTQVRMLAETVLIDVQNDIQPESLGSARITADFTMRSLGAADERMAVRFPISADNGRGDYPEIANIAIKVNGKTLPYRQMDYPDPRSQEVVPWAEFDITFPAGKDTAIQVSYTLRGTGYFPYTAFFYLLETGAGWKDTIGSADIILRMPYPAGPQNVVLDTEIGWGTTTRGAVFEGNEARWHFEDFEPGPYSVVQNMEFALVAPSAWNAVLTERKKTASNPNDGEAWGRLGRAYKRIFLMNRGYRTDPGGAELYSLGVEAYEKCLAIKPEDAQWHAGFADLLVNYSYWEAWAQGPTAETYRGLEEIHTALRLAPNDPKVKEIATNIYYMFPEGVSETDSGFDFPWLTQTPTAIPPTPTIAVVFDPAAVSGVYHSDTLDLLSGKQVQLVATLNLDHSASLETTSENAAPVTWTGTWTDTGDGRIMLSVTDPDYGPVSFVFAFDQDQLDSVEWPGLYGEAGITLVKPASAAPAAAASATPEPAATATLAPTPSATPEPVTALKTAVPAPTSAPKPPSKAPICGSAALIPMFGIILWTTGRNRRSRSG